MEIATFKKLLIPIDFSVASENALNYGLSLASKIGAKIVLLHTYNFKPMVDISGQYISFSDLKAQTLAQGEQKLHELKTKITASHPEISLEYLLMQDNLAEAVEAVCKEQNIDLVVMGTKGASGFEEYLVGTNTAVVIESIKSPVLVIPSKAKFHDIKKILFTTDFQFDDVESLEALVEIAKIFKAKIEVVHFSKDIKSDEELLDWLKEICEERVDYKLINFTNLLEGSTMLNTLNKLIKKREVDLVSMSASDKPFLKKIFTGSYTQKMAYHTDIPFLAFHIRKLNKL